MAAFLALLAAVLFGLAATLQQRGQFALARRGSAVEGVGGLVRLLAVPIWLVGTVVLLLGYALQGAALDRGKLVVVIGLALFRARRRPRRRCGERVDGEPAAGDPGCQRCRGCAAPVVTCEVVCGGARCGARRVRGPVLRPRGGLREAGAQHDLHVSIGEAAGDWRTWALLGFGFAGFLLQQLSLATGQLALAMAAVSVSKPAVSMLLGIVPYEERLTRPGWHVAVAFAALLAALGGAVLITLANRETELPVAASA